MGKIIELINNFDSLFGIFIPGAVCVWFYTKLSLKKYEAQVYFIMSIRSVYKELHADHETGAADNK